MPMLSLQHVTGGWGQTVIVEDFSLAVEPGEIVSIVGRNGAGKTTLLEIIMGRARLGSGQILLDGAPLQRLPIFERCRAGLGYVPQGREVFPSLTVTENLTAAVRPGEWTIERLFELFPGLAQRADSFGHQLSGGEQQMLSIARALIGNPKVLLMDEPTEGLAPIVIEEIVSVIRQLASTRAITVLLVEQVVDVALELSDRCCLLERGQIQLLARAQDLRADRTQIEAIFGLSAQ
jgi:branched-chain amino acid transport system ATP-binding protein